jgi:hypothetical protein
MPLRAALQPVLRVYRKRLALHQAACLLLAVLLQLPLLSTVTRRAPFPSFLAAMLSSLSVAAGMAVPSLARHFTSRPMQLLQSETGDLSAASLRTAAVIIVSHGLAGVLMTAFSMQLAPVGAVAGVQSALRYLVRDRGSEAEEALSVGKLLESHVHRGLLGGLRSGALMALVEVLMESTDFYVWGLGVSSLSLSFTPRVAVMFLGICVAICVAVELSWAILHAILVQPVPLTSLPSQGSRMSGSGAELLLSALLVGQDAAHDAAMLTVPTSAKCIRVGEVGSWRGEMEWHRAALEALAVSTSAAHLASGAVLPQWMQFAHLHALSFLADEVPSDIDLKREVQAFDCRQMVRCCCLEIDATALQLNLITYEGDADVLRQSLLSSSTGTGLSLLVERVLVGGGIKCQKKSLPEALSLGAVRSSVHPRPQLRLRRRKALARQAIRNVSMAARGGTMLVCQAPGSARLAVGEQVVPSLLYSLAGLQLAIKTEGRRLQSSTHVRLSQHQLLMPELQGLPALLDSCIRLVCQTYR